MRILLAAAVAAFFAAGTLSASAQAPAPAAAAKPKACKTLKSEADCTPRTDCTWTAGTGTAKGKCTKAKK